MLLAKKNVALPTKAKSPGKFCQACPQQSTSRARDVLMLIFYFNIL